MADPLALDFCNIRENIFPETKKYVDIFKISGGIQFSNYMNGITPFYAAQLSGQKLNDDLGCNYICGGSYISDLMPNLIDHIFLDSSSLLIPRNLPKSKTLEKSLDNGIQVHLDYLPLNKNEWAEFTAATLEAFSEYLNDKLKYEGEVSIENPAFLEMAPKLFEAYHVLFGGTQK